MQNVITNHAKNAIHHLDHTINTRSQMSAGLTRAIERNAAMTREIYLDVIRLRRYGWRWGIITSIINRKHGTQYEARQLEIYLLSEQGTGRTEPSGYVLRRR